MLLLSTIGLVIVIVVGVVLAALLILLIAKIIKQYNFLVSMRNKVKNAWAQINVQLNKRYDLIPNLVNTVKGYATHEKETLTDVTKWRNQGIAAASPEDAMKAEAGLNGALARLLVSVEKYPELKANAEFAALRNELTEIEDKIAFTRQFYNDVVYKNNNAVEHFPGNLIANWFKFKAAVPFEIDDTMRTAPVVKF